MNLHVSLLIFLIIIASVSTNNCCGSCNNENNCSEKEKQVNEKINSDHKSSTLSNTEPQVNVTTKIKITNRINNINEVNIPVKIDEVNVNDILVTRGNYAQKVDKEVTFLKYKNETSNNCCLVAEPEQCRFQNEEVACKRDLRKDCSNICESPLVLAHPTSTAERCQFAYRGKRSPQLFYQQPPFTNMVPGQVLPYNNANFQPYSLYQFPQYPNNPQHPSLSSFSPIQQYPNIAQPYESQYSTFSQKPCPLQDQSVESSNLHQYQTNNQECPSIYYKGTYYPICNDLKQASYLQNTNNPFIVDSNFGEIKGKIRTICIFYATYPYFRCDKIILESCFDCLFCDGQVDLKKCILSPKCSKSCQDILKNNKIADKIGKQLKCEVVNGTITCK